jgi:site-specific DNA recombinase
VTTPTAAIYARISSDDGTALGVARQVEDCTALAAKRGWSIAETFIDNDVSASSGVRRPEYERLIEAIKREQVGALVVWDVDRLTRTPSELEQFIGLADAHSIALASVGGEVDLATPQGRLTARIKGSVARHEVEQSSRRLKRKFLERAEAGKSHGKVAYGYVREPVFDDSGVVKGYVEQLHPVHAQIIRTSAAHLLAGEPLRAVVSGLNTSGAVSPAGKPWSGTTLRQVLLRERNAGRRVHQGQVIGRGDWPAILDEDTFDRLVAMMRDPRRRTNSGSEIVHLLSGIAKCGRCGGVLRGAAAHVSGKKRQPRAYFCAGCYKLRRKADAVDEVVEGVVVARLSRPDAAGLFGGNPGALKQASDQVQAIEARMEIAADQFAEGGITGPQLERITAKLKPQLEAARASLRAHEPSPEMDEFTGPKAGQAWERATIDRRRAVIEAIMTITILPSGAGKTFDPEQVKIEWKAQS